MTIRKIEKALNSETVRINDMNITKMFMKNVMTKLFFEYRDLNEAFNQSQVKELSSHRFYDVKIKLNENRSQLSRSRIYFISKHKL